MIAAFHERQYLVHIPRFYGKKTVGGLCIFCATASNIKYGVIWGEEGNIHKSFIRALTFQDKRKRVD